MPSRFLLILSPAFAATLMLGACSSGYDDTYYDDNAATYYGTNYQDNTIQVGDIPAQQHHDQFAAFGANGAFAAPNPYMGTPTVPGCMPGGATHADNGLRYGGTKSRYGGYHYYQEFQGGCQGYWIIPTYHIIETETPPPVVETAPPPSITIEPCPDGQYRMDNGTCAIMMTEEPEQYVPPIIQYPEVPTPQIEWYEPIRK